MFHKVVEKKCTCGTVSAVTVPLSGYQAWEAGTFIQTAMPELSATEREILITGYCAECQNIIFAEEE